MKLYFEKNIRIINELMTYFHRLGCNDINVKLNTKETYSTFTIWGKVGEIRSEDLLKLDRMLNIPRQRELEEYFWSIDSDCQFEEDLSVVGIMTDKVDVTYNESILKLQVHRNDI